MHYIIYRLSIHKQVYLYIFQRVLSFLFIIILLLVFVVLTTTCDDDVVVAAGESIIPTDKLTTKRLHS